MLQSIPRFHLEIKNYTNSNYIIIYINSSRSLIQFINRYCTLFKKIQNKCEKPKGDDWFGSNKMGVFGLPQKFQNNNIF